MRFFKTCKLPEHFPVAWRSFSACSEPSVNMHWTWAAKSQQTQESWRTSQAWLCRVHGEHRKGEVHVGLLFLSVKPLHASSGVNRHNADSSRRNMEHRRRDWKRGNEKHEHENAQLAFFCTLVAHAQFQYVQGCIVDLLHDVWKLFCVCPCGSRADSAVCAVMQRAFSIAHDG